MRSCPLILFFYSYLCELLLFLLMCCTQDLCFHGSRVKSIIMFLSQQLYSTSQWYSTYSIYIEITPQRAQRPVLFSVSLLWVNMMMQTVINSNSHRLEAWGTGRLMAALRSFIGSGRCAFYLYGALETEQKCYYTKMFFFFFFFYPLPKPSIEAKSKWNAMQMNPNGLLTVCMCVCVKEGFNVMPHVEHQL